MGQDEDATGNNGGETDREVPGLSAEPGYKHASHRQGRAREQPGLIVVDRAVPGPYQDYLTPENTVPDKPLPYPWETCMPMATSWSYVPHDHYKSVNKLIHLLVDIVSKGGNFLLNIGPNSQGDWSPTAYERLKGIGDWMKVNSEAIYDTHPVAPYKQGKVCLTQLDDGTTFRNLSRRQGRGDPALEDLDGQYPPGRKREGHLVRL